MAQHGIRRADLAALAAIAAVPLVKFAPVTVGAAVFSAGDHAWINLPLKAVTRAAFREGALPLWNKALSCGTPQLAQGEAGVFYPGNVLVHWPALDLYRAYGWTLLGHLVALGWAMYVLLRIHRCRPAVAGVFAGLLCLSPYVLFTLPTSNVLQTLWVVPLLFVCLEVAARGSPVAAGLGGGVLLGQQLLLGRPALLVYGWLTLGVVGVVRALGAPGRARALGRLTSFLIIAVLLGTALGGVQLVPTLGFVAQSTRGPGLQADFGEAGGWLSFSRLYALFLFPTFPTEAGRYTAYHTSDPFLGLVPLLLIVVGLAVGTGRTRERGLPVLAGAIFSLMLAMGPTIPLWRGLWSWPPLSMLRYPGRALPVFLCLAFLFAALAWEELRRRARLPGRATAVAVVLVVASGLACYLPAASHVTAPWLAPWQAALQALPVIAVLAWPRARHRPAWWSAAIVTACAIQAAPLFLYYGYSAEPRREFLAAFEPLSAVARAPVSQRRLAVGGFRPLSLPGANPPSLGNGAILAGAGVVNEFNQFTWGPWKEFLRLTLHRQVKDEAPLPPARSLCDLVGLDWLYFDRERPVGGEAWTPAGGPVPGSGRMRLWRRREPSGYASLVHTVVRRPGTDAAGMARLALSGEIDFRNEVLLTDAGAPGLPGGDGATGRDALLELPSGPNAYRFEVETARPAYLVLRDHDAPGWRAWLDGRPVPHYRADGFFKAAFVPSGSHRVEFRYRPRAFRAGLVASLAGLVATLALAGWCGRRRLVRGRFP